MNDPHAKPHEDLDQLLKGMSHELGAITGRSSAEAAPPPARPAPPAAGFAGGRGGGRMWGPSTTRIDHPLMTLQHCAETAYLLHGQVEQLLHGLSGEQRQQPLGPRPVTEGPLLPAISRLATEIEGVLTEIGRLVEHMKGKL